MIQQEALFGCFPNLSLEINLSIPPINVNKNYYIIDSDSCE